jgi:hypothetical protein
LSAQTLLSDTSETSKERRISWYHDDYNFIHLRYDQLLPRLVCVCVIDEQWVYYDSAVVGMAEWDGSDGAWHTLALEVEAGRFAAYRDGKLIFEDQDSLFLQLPRTGFVEISNTYSATCFDDVLLMSLEGSEFVCGDVDSDGIVNVSDVVFLLNYIFGGGPPPQVLAAADCDCSDTVNVADAVWLLSYIFAGGPKPCAACS